MAEGLVTDLIKQLLSTAAWGAEQEIRLVVGVEKEIRKLEGNLQTVKAVLNDAEKRQITEEAVKLWLEKLNNVCYEMDDVLDEWNTELIKSAIQKEEEEKNADSALVLKKQIKELDGIIDEITKEKDRYQFQLTNDLSPKVVERPQTTSFVDVSEIYGRDSIKDDLVGMLLGKGSEEESSPHIISLVGMGGIGKTTLAQLAYNDPKVQAHFEIKVWVCVSNPFDQCKVAKEILESIEHQSPNLTALQGLLEKITIKVWGKKFFLVLDDVWMEDSIMWEPFKNALKMLCPRVAKVMGSVSVTNLELLSKKDCWSVFSKIAFFDRDPKQREQLEDLGWQMVEKCKGLPLAAKTLGSLMRFKRSREEWKSILDNNLWEFEDVERSLYAPLSLSYYDLSSPLRQCFSFCAVFPKDYVFSSNELVFMWMAQGYIKSKANMEMEIIARDYFEILAMRSFFHDFEKNEDNSKIKKCKMHDIVHDFAQLMSKNECFSINSDKECLRILSLNGDMLKELPDAVENFIHLRYLNLVDYCGNGLPETICHLSNLQTLKIIIGSNEFQKLPQGISKLINLRHFILDFNNWFGRLTSLRTLNYFSVSGKDDSNRCKLGELRNLNHLYGTLDINGLGSEIDACDAEHAQLKKKIGLHTLILSFDEWDGEEIIREKDALVLNALEPPPNLEYLSIGMYRGPTMFPNWMMSLNNLKKLYMSNLSLEHLPPLGKLPSLEIVKIWVASSVKKVSVEFLGIEASGKKENDDKITIIAFPNLKSLSFSYLQEWEEWNGIGGEEEDCVRFTIMPRLQHLKISECLKLKSLPNFLRTTPLQKLDIYNSPILKERCKRGTGEEWPKISHIPKLDEDEDQKDESNEDEVDKEEEDKGLQDKKEDDEVEHL
ncbi:hypothetical protein RGQ29_033185 [Quercus rubra]|uniref:Uncharacterized protein n=1 Tax=Quercus rubra TaxID=3512 RepID=A0AAN7DTZ1_QUERU|nr:hypothetical protein RGQ29_033185 [Quercus rubra]